MAEVELEAVRAVLGRRGQEPGPVEVGTALRSVARESVVISTKIGRVMTAAASRFDEPAPTGQRPGRRSPACAPVCL